jgi:hypothetical protein
MNEKKSTDIFGIAPYGEAINTTVKKTFKGVESFLKAVCMPALDEVGLMLKDQVRYWRLINILKIIEKAKGKVEFNGDQLELKAHPRVALAIIENGSLNDDDEIQNLWAGLFASSCIDSEQTDENLIFVDLLKQLTNNEAKILKYACEKTRKIIHKNGLVTAERFYCQCDELISLTGNRNIHSIDRQLDHLRSLELIVGGFDAQDQNLIADISPTDLALNLYVRSQGSTKTTSEYWNNSLFTLEQIEQENTDKSKAQ